MKRKSKSSEDITTYPKQKLKVIDNEILYSNKFDALIQYVYDLLHENRKLRKAVQRERIRAIIEEERKAYALDS